MSAQWLNHCSGNVLSVYQAQHQRAGQQPQGPLSEPSVSQQTGDKMEEALV
jgi:hypothetical protein